MFLPPENLVERKARDKCQEARKHPTARTIMKNGGVPRHPRHSQNQDRRDEELGGQRLRGVMALPNSIKSTRPQQGDDRFAKQRYCYQEAKDFEPHLMGATDAGRLDKDERWG